MWKGKKTLLAVTGGIAAYKIPFLIRTLLNKGAEVRVVMTTAAKSFVTPLTLATVSEQEVYINFTKKKKHSLEWQNHVKLADWADMCIIAPATINTIAKIKNGICDNFLLATFFSLESKDVFIFPAMDKEMYLNKTVQDNLIELKKKYTVFEPNEGFLASGKIGVGRMLEPEEICDKIEDSLYPNKDTLKGKKVLITAGPTYEDIDPVRFIGNYSTGKMGLSLAKIALKMGAEKVILVIGPNSLEKIQSHKIEYIDVRTAEQIYSAVEKNIEQSDLAIFSAAVSDFRPDKTSLHKIKKEEKDTLQLNLVRNTDILCHFAKNKKTSQKMIGFALETENIKENGIKKLKQKNLDFIVINTISKYTGFGVDTNQVTLIDKNGEELQTEISSKDEIARFILEKTSL